MSTEPETPATGGALVPQQRQRAVVENVQPLFDTGKFEHFQRAATALMNSTLLPPSVRGDSAAQCFSNLILIFEIADRWKMPATAIAQCVSIVHGKLMFEGKVITAMLESTLAVRLQYHWTGERGSPDYRIFVWDKSFDPKEGHITQEQLDALAPDKYPPGARMIDGSVGDWRTFQKDNRTPNPAWTGAASRNQLAYRGSREWARLFESGQMLGVYGDDEISAWEDRAPSNLVDVTPRPAISTGFSRPAPVDAEFTDVVETAQDAPGQAEGETGQQTTDAPAADAGAQAQAADKPKRRQVAQVSAAVRADGRACGLQGLSPEPPSGLGAEETDAWMAGHREGSDARPPIADHVESTVDTPTEDGERTGLALDAFEAGHEAGLKGEGGDVPKAWTDNADDFTDGWHSGAAERLQDATDEGDGLDDDFAGDQAEDEPAGPFAAFSAGVRSLATWGDVRAALGVLSRTDEWKAALAQRPPYDVRAARVAAGLRLVELQTHGTEPLDIQATDLTAFRCWMEGVEDQDLILAKWQELVQAPAYQALEPDQRRKMEATVKARVADLKQPSLT